MWFARDLPVLKVVVEHIDENGPLNDIRVIEDRAGLERREVERALRSLNDSGEFLVKASRTAMRHPDKTPGESWYIHAVTGQAKREAGCWPTSQALAEDLIAQLEKQAETETDPEKKSRIKGFIKGTSQAGREIAIDVMASVLKQQMGI